MNEVYTDLEYDSNGRTLIEAMKPAQDEANLRMDEQKKYFTPSIEDIRVGYEAEANWEYYRNPDGTKSSNPDGWKPLVFKGVDEAVRKYHQLGMYRIPYLTKEQIEAEGWEQRGDERYFYKNNYLIFYQFHSKRLWVTFQDPKLDKLFIGECKDINTFRYICKLLNI